jgi:hypothetical protein
MDTSRPTWSDGRTAVAIHQSSINQSQIRFKHRFLVFHEKVKTSKVYLRDCTVVSPYALLLFGGPITVKVRTLHDFWIPRFGFVEGDFRRRHAPIRLMLLCVGGVFLAAREWTGPGGRMDPTAVCRAGKTPRCLRLVTYGGPSTHGHSG